MVVRFTRNYSNVSGEYEHRKEIVPHKDAKAQRLESDELDGLMVRVSAPSRLCGVFL